MAARMTVQDIIKNARPGDRITIQDRFGKSKSGRVVMRAKHGGWVLNMGGKHGTPGIADEKNIVGATIDKKKYVVESIMKESAVDYWDSAEKFADLLKQRVKDYFTKEYPDSYDIHKKSWEINLKEGKKWIKIDVGQSGKFMLNKETGNLHFIKGYGTPDLKKNFGNIDSILKNKDKWWYDGYSISPKGKKSAYGYAGRLESKITKDRLREIIKEEIQRLNEAGEAKIKEGDTLVSKWGYDQTNADFYKVVKRTESGAHLQKVESKVVKSDGQKMTGAVIPTNKKEGKVIRRKVKGGHDGYDEFVEIDKYKMARPWNKQPVRISWYG